MSNCPPIAAKKKDIQEWVEGSVVSEAIAELNLQTLEPAFLTNFAIAISQRFTE